MSSGEVVPPDNEVGFQSLEWIESQRRMFLYFDEGFPPPLEVFVVVEGVEHMFLPLGEWRK